MQTFASTAKLLTGSLPGTEADTPPIAVELAKKANFCRFLEKEMSTVKTEAERETVQTILLKTKVEIRRMERQWKRMQAAVHGSTRSSSEQGAEAYPVRRIQ
jgi:hypothetical protein